MQRLIAIKAGIMSMGRRFVSTSPHRMTPHCRAEASRSFLGRPFGRLFVLGLLVVPVLAGCETLNEAKPKAKPRAANQAKAIVLVMEQSEAALKEGRHYDAEAGFRKVLLFDRKNKRAKFGLGDVYIARKNLNGALAVFDDIEKLYGKSPRTLQGRGLALLAARKRQAKKLLKEAVAGDAKLWRSWNALGLIYDGERKWQLAHASYANALKAGKNNAYVHNNIGFSFLLQRKDAVAIQHFEKALDIDPTLTVARSNLRLALAARGRYVEALAGVPKTEIPTILNNIGYVAMLRGEYDKAEALFRRALDESASYYKPAAGNLARLKFLRGTAKKAKRRRGRRR